MTSLAQKRRGEAAWWAAIAVLALVLAALAYGVDARRRAPPDSPGLAAPVLASRPSAAEIIVVQTKDATYRLARDGRGWTMKDRGGYPVRQDSVAQFTADLAALRYGRPMTRDPKKHALLGLDDPRESGAGALVQVQDSQGALLADLIVGRAGGALYVRAHGAAQTWTAASALIDVRDASTWLDLRPFAIAPERIVRVDVARPEAAYAILRGEQGFTVGRPYSERPVIEPARLERVAAGLGALDPTDVAPAPALTGAPAAKVVLQTSDGLAVDAELFAKEGRAWVRLAARALAPERAAEAAAINRRAGPWAFALATAAGADAAPPIADLVRLPQPEPTKSPSPSLSPSPRPKPEAAPAPNAAPAPG